MNKRGDLSSLLVIDPTAAAICSGDPTVHSRLELEWKCTLLHKDTTVRGGVYFTANVQKINLAAWGNFHFGSCNRQPNETLCYLE